MKNQIFPPQILQETPLDDVFLQARTNLQRFCELGEYFQVKWNKIGARQREFSSLIFLLSFGRERYEREEGFECSILPWKLEEIVAKKLCKSQLRIVFKQ